MVSVSLTMQANLANMTWPYVVFPDFQVQGILSNQVTGASTLTLHPLVQHQDRVQYENFTVHHHQWLERAHMYNDQVHPQLYNHNEENTADEAKEVPISMSFMASWNESGITPYIWRYDQGLQQRVPDYQHDMYFPMWQQAPAEDYTPTTNMNFADLGDTLEQVVTGMIQASRPSLTAVGEGAYLPSSYKQHNDVVMDGTPRTFLLQPVYDNLLENRQMVAFLSASMRYVFCVVHVSCW